MIVLLRTMLRTDHIGTTTLNLLRSSLATTTYAYYDSYIRQFAAFYHEEGIHPLHATTQSIVRDTPWLGLQGTVAVASIQYYCSAINKLFRDHQQQPIAVGDLLADAPRGLEMKQQRLLVANSTIPVLLEATTHLREHLTWTPPTRHAIARFRATLAVCTNYAFFCKARTGVRYLTHDVIVDRPS
jgi:hypothetical protein